MSERSVSRIERTDVRRRTDDNVYFSDVFFFFLLICCDGEDEQALVKKWGRMRGIQSTATEESHFVVELRLCFALVKQQYKTR